MENPGRYSKCIYFEEDSSLYINLYIPSELNWVNKDMKLRLETRYPFEDNIIIRITEGVERLILRYAYHPESMKR